MKNKFKLFILMILCSFLLVGCDQLSGLLEINNISINEETISEMMNIEDFNLEDLEIIIEYQNGKTKKIPINSNMISEEDLLKFQKPGKHTIRVNYQGFEASFEIILHDGNLDVENAVVVVFMNHDETIYFTAAIDEDGRIKAPEVPSREGYKFIGWYVGENQFDFSQKVTESVIVYAKWTEKEYNVTVVDCFGNTLAEAKCKYNHPFDVMPYVPENYNFEKCTVNGEEWISNSDLIIGDTLIIVEASVDEYEISLNVNGGDELSQPVIAYNSLMEIKLPVPTREGYLFLGWYNENVKVEKINKGTTGNLELVAKWSEINEDNTIYLIKGDHFQFDLSEFAEEILELIDFTSSDEKVLSIDKKGKIKTHKVGESIVTLKAPFVNIETIFLVKVMELEDFNIAVSPDFISEALEVLADQEFELTTNIDEYINLEDFIIWEVDDPSMAEIIDGNKIRIFSKLGKLDIKLKTLAGDTFIVSVNVVGKK